jgi:predicted permease
LARTLIRVASTPIVFGIALGVMVAVSGISVPEPVGQTFDLISACAGPLALVALGLDVAHYDVRRGARAAGLICGLKLLVQPFVAWGLCRGMNLPRLETEVVVLMASLAVGVNVHLMAQRFKAQEAAVASALVSSTLLGIVTTPLVVSLLCG